MSIRVMSHVWEHSTAKGGDLLVLLALADFSDDAGHSYPSLQTLARKARLSERATQYALNNLIAAGELAIDRQAGRGHVNRYKVQTLHPIPAPEKGADFAPPKGADFAPIPPEKVQSATKKVQPTAPRTVKNRQIHSPTENAPAPLSGLAGTESLVRAFCQARNVPFESIDAKARDKLHLIARAYREVFNETDLAGCTQYLLTDRWYYGISLTSLFQQAAEHVAVWIADGRPATRDRENPIPLKPPPAVDPLPDFEEVMRRQRERRYD